jgi:hypothetical protein
MKDQAQGKHIRKKTSGEKPAKITVTMQEIKVQIKRNTKSRE